VSRAFDGRKELMKDVVRVVTHVKKQLFISISTELVKVAVNAPPSGLFWNRGSSQRIVSEIKLTFCVT